jgi:hypothetical protein
VCGIERKMKNATVMLIEQIAVALSCLLGALLDKVGGRGGSWPLHIRWRRLRVDTAARLLHLTRIDMRFALP